MNAPLTPQPMLSDAWVERIFDSFQGRFGSAWLDMWRDHQAVELPNGKTIDHGMMLAKLEWARRLAGFDNPEDRGRIVKAMRAEYQRPPFLDVFIGICRQGPTEQRLAIADATPVKPETKAKADQMFATVAGKRMNGEAFYRGVLDDLRAGKRKRDDMCVEFAFEAFGGRLARECGLDSKEA